MNKILSKISTIATMVALFLAIAVGLTAPSFAKSIKMFGDYYVSILKVFIGPIIFCSMSLAILNRDRTKKFLLSKTILLFVIMFVVTFLLSSLIVFLAKPGTYFHSSSTETTSKFADFSITSILKNLVPTSLEDFLMGKNIFFVIIITIILAFIISKTKFRNGYTDTICLFKKCVDLIMKVIIYLTPFAVFSLVSNMIASYDVKAFEMGVVYILFAYGLSILAIIVVMILPVWIYAKINPLTYIKKASKVWLMTISTCSSAATLPYTIKVCNEEFGVDEKITNIVVPLGCTIHMCGGAVSFSLLGLFVAQMSGVTITFPLFLLMLLSATLINMAAPGIPGGGVVIGMTYLSMFNLPLDMFYGMYVGMYKLLDMSYTTLNVTGDISANIIIDRTEKRKQK